MKKFIFSLFEILAWQGPLIFMFIQGYLKNEASLYCFFTAIYVMLLAIVVAFMARKINKLENKIKKLEDDNG